MESKNFTSLPTLMDIDQKTTPWLLITNLLSLENWPNGSTSIPLTLSPEELLWSMSNLPEEKLKPKLTLSNLSQDTSDFTLPEITTANILDSMEISNNGSSWMVMVHGSSQDLLIANSQVVVKNQPHQLKPASSCMPNVVTAEWAPEFVVILHSLILTMMSNPSKSQPDKLSTFTTCLVSMEPMPCSLNLLIVSILMYSLCLRNTELPLWKKKSSYKWVSECPLNIEDLTSEKAMSWRHIKDDLNKKLLFN